MSETHAGSNVELSPEAAAVTTTASAAGAVPVGAASLAAAKRKTAKNLTEKLAENLGQDAQATGGFRRGSKARRAKKPPQSPSASAAPDAPAPPAAPTAPGASAPPAAPCPEWLHRIERLYDRAEALLAAWLGAFWVPVESDGKSGAFAVSHAKLSGFSAEEVVRGAPAAGPYPPGLDAPLREPPALRDLSAALICLRRIQDARIALERGLLDPSANPAAAGGSPNGDEGNGIDINTLHTAVYRVLRPSPSAQAEDLDEDPLRD